LAIAQHVVLQLRDAREAEGVERAADPPPERGARVVAELVRVLADDGLEQQIDLEVEVVGRFAGFSRSGRIVDRRRHPRESQTRQSETSLSTSSGLAR